jgi:HSP20 family protein
MKSLIPWRQRNGGGFLEPFRQEMESVFERFFGEHFPEVGKVAQTWAPRVDIEETEKEILVKADLPGVDPKDVEITVNEGALILKGEKKEEHEEKKKNFHSVERFVGKFYREIPLPSGTDPENIAAVTSKGVITVTIPKKPEAQPKKIAVKPQD